MKLKRQCRRGREERIESPSIHHHLFKFLSIILYNCIHAIPQYHGFGWIPLKENHSRGSGFVASQAIPFFLSDERIQTVSFCGFGPFCLPVCPVKETLRIVQVAVFMWIHRGDETEKTETVNTVRTASLSDDSIPKSSRLSADPLSGVERRHQNRKEVHRLRHEKMAQHKHGIWALIRHDADPHNHHHHVCILFIGDL